MRNINIDRNWQVMDAPYSMVSLLMGTKSETINVPLDSMVAEEVSEKAPGSNAYGYYATATKSYTKQLEILEEWKKDDIWIHFDGVMGQAIPELNGYQYGVHHYGYTPFYVNITDRVNFNGKNRFSITVNPGQEPSSRWYPGQGLYRSVVLVHAPKIHIASMGIYSHTDRIEQEGDTTYAYLTHEVKITNRLTEDHIVRVSVSLIDEATGETICSRNSAVAVNALSESTARIPMTVKNPKLWDAENPNLYKVEVRSKDLGLYKTHLMKETADANLSDVDSTLFGIRMITADSTHGLRINGNVVKLKGGCQHHDNGMIGTASYYDAEYRRIRMLKDAGYNAIRTSHNPPSTALLEACDRLGMYVFDEAFDMWNMSKTAGDYSLYFKDHWKEDLTAFITRDRNHPSVIIWSTGNEIMERGGLTDGYQLAAELADFTRALDPSRPVSNAICSYWSGLDDELGEAGMRAFASLGQDASKDDSPVASIQNADITSGGVIWEELSEPFAEHLDIVGYNYGEDMYENDTVEFPDRVILGTESDPNQIDKIWKLVKKLPAVIGDFTWTSWDYIGEAGIGQSLYVEPGDPRIKMGPFAVSSHASQFPWRTANDADFDLTGYKMPQGVYRSIVWGSDETGIFSYDPAVHDKIEIVGNWGWPYIYDNWSWNGQEGKPVTLVVYSAAEEVEVIVNGKTLGRKPAGEEKRFSATFETTYQPGEVTAISYNNGQEVSRASLHTAGRPVGIRLVADTIGTKVCAGMNGAGNPAEEMLSAEGNITEENVSEEVSSTLPALSADGHTLAFIRVEVIDDAGNIVPSATVDLTAIAEGAGELLGFGSAAPVTSENYTTGKFATYHGRAQAILRSDTKPGDLTLKVDAGALGTAELMISVE